MRIRTFKTKKSQKYFFSVMADDNEVIFRSTPFDNKQSRDEAKNTILTAARKEQNFVRKGGEGARYFEISVDDVLVKSVTYTSDAALNSAINDVLKMAGSLEGGKPYAEKKGGDDDYKPLSFYEKNAPEVETGFSEFEAEGEWYFCYKIDNKVILISEGYTSGKGRDNGVNSVTKNMVIDKRFDRQIHENGKFYFNLKAGNHQEIATSRWFDSENERDEYIGFLTRGGSGSGARNMGLSLSAEVEEKKKRKKRKKKPKADKVILDNGMYFQNGVKWQTFQSGGNKRFYFILRTPEDKSLFFNANVRGYETKEEAEAGLKLAMERAKSKSNYIEKVAKNGKFYFYVLDENEKNIGKSFFYASEQEMRDAYGLLLFDGAIVSSPVTEKVKAKQDDYLSCSQYKGDSGFYKFENEGEYYFAYNNNTGKTLLRSEGYKNAASRDNGIESVIKNSKIEARWKTEEKMDGKYHFYYLIAGNHQEIARSCAFSSKDEMESSIGWILGDNSILSPNAEFRNGKWWTVSMLHAENKKVEAEANALALKNKEEAQARAVKKEKEVERKMLHQDDYLVCSAYAGDEGFYKFEKDGDYYFAYNNKEGKTLLRSEGYSSAAGRDNGIESVIKNSQIEERWKREVVLDKYHFYYLVAGNHQEIARSCAFRSVDEMNSSWGWVRGGDSYLGMGAAFVGGQWLTSNMAIEVEKKKAEEDATRLRLLAEEKAKKEEETARLAALELERKNKAAEAERARLAALELKKKEEETARLAALELERKNKAAEAERARLAALELKKKEEETARLAALELERKNKAAEAAKLAALALAATKKKEAEEEKARFAALELKKKEESARLAKIELEKKQKAEAEALIAKEKAEADAKKKKVAAAALAASLALAATKKKEAEEEKARFAALELKKKEETARLAKIELDKKQKAEAEVLIAKEKAEADAKKKKVAAAALAASLAATSSKSEKKVEVVKKERKTVVTTSDKVRKKEAVPPVVATTSDKPGCFRPWMWLLLLLIPLLWFLLKGCDGCNKPAIDKQKIEAPVTTAEKPVEAEVKVKPKPICPLCQDLKLEAGSTNCNIADYISNPESSYPKRFSISDVTFGNNKISLSKNSRNSIDKIADIFNGCDAVKVTVYANMGNGENASYGGNKEIMLAEHRSNAVYKRLIKKMKQGVVSNGGEGDGNNRNIELVIYKK